MSECKVCNGKVPGILKPARGGGFVHQECAREVKRLVSLMGANIERDENPGEELNDRIRLAITRHKMEQGINEAAEPLQEHECTRYSSGPCNEACCNICQGTAACTSLACGLCDNPEEFKRVVDERRKST